VNAATLTATGTFPAYYLFGMALTPDGQQLYAASSSGTLTIIDRATRTVVNSLYLGGTPRRIAFDEKGFTAVVANEGNWVDVIK